MSQSEPPPLVASETMAGVPAHYFKLSVDPPQTQCAHIVHVSSFKLIKEYPKMVIAVLFVLCTAFAAAVATLGFTTAFTPTTILHAMARRAVTLRRRTSSLSGDVLSPLVNLLQDEESDADVRGSSSVRELIPVNSFIVASTVLLASTAVAAGSPSFAAPLFADGMILQRGSTTQVWGAGAAAGAAVTVTVGSGPSAKTATSTATATGSWQATLPDTPATLSTTLSVRASGSSSAATSLRDVAFGDVLLCGGQSNMGFGMCGAKSATQSPQQALMTLAPLRFYFQSGTGPNGGTGEKCSSGLPAGPNNHNISSTTPYEWFKSNASNSGGYSAVCMLTAQRLYVALGKKVPVGAVESCVGGSQVRAWIPDATNKKAGGKLWKAHMVPLLPMTFKAALWDQGEADAKRTSSAWCVSERCCCAFFSCVLVCCCCCCCCCYCCFDTLLHFLSSIISSIFEQVCLRV